MFYKGKSTKKWFNNGAKNRSKICWIWKKIKPPRPKKMPDLEKNRTPRRNLGRFWALGGGFNMENFQREALFKKVWREFSKIQVFLEICYQKRKRFSKGNCLRKKIRNYFFRPQKTWILPLKSVFVFLSFLRNLLFFSKGFTGNTTFCFFTKPIFFPKQFCFERIFWKKWKKS